MNGTLVELAIDSPALAGNPLADPSRRTVLAWVPPGGAAGLPAIYFLHGFTGSARGWLNVSVFAPTVPERLDALVAAGEIPPVVAVFPDGMTAVGGTQWTDAPAVGRYQSYVADDVVREVEARLGTIPRREARAALGKSSGGYGALCLGRDRGDVFALVGAHAPDSFFEYCYVPDLPKAAGALAANPDPAAWLADARRRARETKLGPGDHAPLNVIGMAAHYSPNPAAPLGLDLPFELPSGRIREDVWARWLAHDPVRFVPAHADAYRRLEGVYLDAGTRDEFNLRWGVRMVAAALRDLGAKVEHQEFEDGHVGTSYRYEQSVRWIAARLARK
ncbi:MAG TPA: alpha/beta hydrolase-fold protein [Candidatus Limnocylindria bacterium]|nr:alpha/beta hydrolase-fold protein [Candidatus Limnocylindria bacterium]